MGPKYVSNRPYKQYICQLISLTFMYISIRRQEHERLPVQKTEEALIIWTKGNIQSKNMIIEPEMINLYSLKIFQWVLTTLSNF